MIITFEKDKMIVKHPSGVVTEYSVEYLEKHKQDLLDQAESQNVNILNIQNYIDSIISLGV